MNQEIQLTNSTPTAADYWTQGQPPVATAPKMSPLKKIHRLLRGRYPLALFLAGATALAGAAVGYMAAQPKFESDGLINVNPVITGASLTDPMIPMYNMWIQSQTAMIESTGVAEDALNNKDFASAWAKAYPGTPLMGAADFVSAINAERAKNGLIIKVAFSDRNKDVAQAGARATIESYMKLHGNGSDYDRRKKLAFLNNQQTELTNSLNFKRKALQGLGEKYGTTDLAGIHQSNLEQLTKLEGDLTQSKIAYDAALVAQGSAPKNDKDTDKAFVYQQIAAVDPTMRTLVMRQEEAQLNMQSAASIYGPNHPQMQRHQEIVAAAGGMVDTYAKDFMARNQGRIPFALDDSTNTASIKMLQSRVDSLQKQVDSQRAKAIELGTQRAQIESLRTDITALETSLTNTTQKIDTLNAEQQLAQNITVVDPGSEGVIASDKRKLAAGVGFVFGGLLPIGLMLMYGMVDHRVRYSDETDSADLAGVTLLGILPNLPDRLSDPQQAGIAAHCVHQIRTMLQINRTNDEPQVVAITSAAPGDGKTSLTLALGLSYAACGARTLLIDCDLVAAGLSHRLNVNAPEGVLESVANRALLEYVRTTDIADVAILPVGTTHAHHASTLSPVALRRLLSEAKKNFDIILVDTGPILGSIEASLVCAAADRTILTVARGQQRLLVERSIGHLQAIGSDVAGVVFNRAQARDFEKSLSGLALRSRTNTNGSAKVANAVTGSFKRAG